MAKLGWVGFAILLANSLLAGWVAWRRYSVASELDTTVQGVVTHVQESSGRSATHVIVATYRVGDKAHTVQGTSNDDASLTASNHPLDSAITVYVSSADPTVAALTPRAGYLGMAAVAALLLCTSLLVGYYVFVKRS